MAFKLSDWVDIKTKEEIEQEHKDYENKMFPLGANHKDVIAQRIADLFTNKKLSKGEIMYNFLVLKQAYMLTDEDKKAKEYDKWYNSVTSKYLSDDEKKIVIALVNADISCEDLAEYKSSDEIREFSKTIVLDKPEKKKGLFSFLKK